MYNFPHQINDLGKLNAALGVFRDLQRRGENLDDDGIVGTAMARAGVYTFRNKSLLVTKALQEEHKKPLSSQGTRTFARDLRRFFMLLAFLHTRIDGSTEVTSMGIHLLALSPASAEAHSVWRTALRHVVLVNPTDQSVAHPYSILLRLVEERPGLEAPRLALALEAHNDSPEEFARILRFADFEEWDEAREEMGVSEHFARDATKILPSLAKQLGDLRSEGNRYYGKGSDSGTDEATSTVERRGRTRRSPRKRTSQIRASGGSRKVGPDSIARAPQLSERPPDEIEFANPEATAERRFERLERHQALVREVAALLVGWELFVDPYDTLAVQKGERPAVLIEAKTLHNSLPDEIAQVRAALAQLLYYDVFDVPATYREFGLIRVAIFEREIAEDHIAFLESFGVVVAWRHGHNRLASLGWSLEVLRSADFPISESDAS